MLKTSLRPRTPVDLSACLILTGGMKEQSRDAIGILLRRDIKTQRVTFEVALLQTGEDQRGENKWESSQPDPQAIDSQNH